MTPSELLLLLPDCCAGVLDSMYFTAVSTSTVAHTLLPSNTGDPIFELTFAGDLSGTFGLRVPASAALSMAANFLGEEEHDLSPSDVADVIGELANMLCGSVVSQIPSARKFVLSHPAPPANLPSAEDLHVIRLDTDYGLIDTWFVLHSGVLLL